LFLYLAKHKAGAVIFVLVAIGSVFAVLYFLERGQERIQHLYVPKLLMLRVDEVPFPKGGKQPIEVVEGTTQVISCDNIIPPPEEGKASYRFHIGGRTYESSKCSFEAKIPGPVNSIQKVGLEYLFAKPGQDARVVDHWEASVRLIQTGEYLRIHRFGRPDSKPIGGLTVPKEVIPYVDAAVKLDGPPENYSVLFFIEAEGTGVPVLQVTGRPGTDQRIEAIEASLNRYRRFAPGVGGYAAWPKEPIKIGSPEDDRMIFEIYAGIFEKKKIPSVVEQLVSFEGSAKGGEAIVKIVPKTTSEIQSLAWHRWLSEPIRVVRAGSDPTAVKQDLSEIPEP
jgi:hypothetical protein